MINHDYRCIYIHIPKTAGNSINRVFGVQWQDHKDLGSYAAEFSPEVIEEYYKFAIVRNPWARMLSDYNYQKKKSRSDKLFLHDSDGEQRLFRAWIEAVLADPFRYAAKTWGGDVSANIHRWSPQVEWMSLDGALAVDKVIHLETLEQGFGEVCSHLGINTTRVPHRNSRFHWHYSWYYDNATRDLIAQYYASDIEAFGYAFDPSPARKLWIGLGHLAGGAPVRQGARLAPRTAFAQVANKRLA
jgi:chondroitin 4-sulfotransferase 11